MLQRTIPQNNLSLSFSGSCAQQFGCFAFVKGSGCAVTTRKSIIAGLYQLPL